MRSETAALALLLLGAMAAAGATKSGGGGEVRATAASPRWFLGGRRTVTRVLLEHSTVTERTPSSCVVVAQSLPPCRSMRGLHERPNIQPAHPHQVLATEPAQLPTQNDQRFPAEPPFLDAAADVQDEDSPRSRRDRIVLVSADDSVKPTATPYLPSQQVKVVTSQEGDGGGWNWNLFGSDVVVTTVLKEVKTRKQPDPNLMITFSVTGCKPTRLPFDLDYCDSVPRIEVSKAQDPREN